MVKFFLGVATVAFTSFCGYLLAKKYKKRMLFFQEFFTFNERFLSEISYYRRPVKEFIALYSYTGEFNELIEDIFLKREEGLPGDKIFLGKEEYCFLKEEDKKTVEDYFFMLGKGDSASQKEYFSSIKDRLIFLRNNAEIESKRYVDLYIKIGFLCGLLILILIV